MLTLPVGPPDDDERPGHIVNRYIGRPEPHGPARTHDSVIRVRVAVDALFMFLQDLDQAGNTFITITPADDDPAWYASVTLLPGGTYDVERADPARGEQHRDTATATDPTDIARDLSIWLAARHHPGRPARSNTDF
jgi:hypothetical protein